MKRFLIPLVVLLLLAGCGPAQPPVVDNGKPGQISAVVFLDRNANGKMDAGEVGMQDQVILGQDISCPPTNPDKYSRNDTDTNGQIVFRDLKPGRYCVAYSGNNPATTKLTIEVDLSSEQELQVVFGILE